MNTKIALSLVATGAFGIMVMLCMVVWKRLDVMLQVYRDMQLQLGRMEVHLHSQQEANAEMVQHIDRLASDVINRELYRAGGTRHVQAIDAARDGQDAQSLIREHGLSIDEAELLMALHASKLQ